MRCCRFVPGLIVYCAWAQGVLFHSLDHRHFGAFPSSYLTSPTSWAGYSQKPMRCSFFGDEVRNVRFHQRLFWNSTLATDWLFPFATYPPGIITWPLPELCTCFWLKSSRLCACAVCWMSPRTMRDVTSAFPHRTACLRHGRLLWR